MSEEEQKTYENETSAKKEEGPLDKPNYWGVLGSKNPAHGGKREGAGRPLGSKSKKPWKGMIELAEKYNLRVIEDAAEMHGQTYKNLKCGSFGDISVFSFYPNKHITTGEGGMLSTNDEELFIKAKSMRNLCFQEHKRFVHEDLGWNLRMTNIQAALGLAQLEKLEEHIVKKRHIGNLYDSFLHNSSLIQTPLKENEFSKNIYWVYGVVLTESISISAEEVQKRLRDLGIGTRPFFWPMHEQPILKKLGLFQDEHYPVSSILGRKGFYLPSGLNLTDSQIEKSANSLLSVLT